MDKNELIERLEELESDHQVDDYSEGFDDGIVFALELAVRLDEPEVLSKGWISDNAVVGQYPNGMGYVVPTYKLQNLLVPKQGEPEKVVLPDFVFNQLEKYKDKGLSLWLAMANGVDYELTDWMTGPNQELYARAWLAYPNIEVEKEKKYYVSSKETVGFWFLYKNNGGRVVIGTNKYYFDADWEVLKLTEQEIKDYDERYWAFAVPVEEVSE